MTVAGRRAFSIGGVLGRTFPIWGRNILQFAFLNAIIHSPLILHAAFAAPEAAAYDPYAAAPETAPPSYFETKLAQRDDWLRFVWVQNIGEYVLGFMATVAVIHGVFQQLKGQPVGIGPCLRVCVSRFLPVLGVSLLLGLLIGGLAVPVGILAVLSRSVIGILFFGAAMIFLTFFFYCMYWVAVPVAVVERPGIVASLRRGAALTRGSRLAIFVIVLTVIAVPFAAGMIGTLVLGQDPRTQAWLGLFVAIVLGALGPVANAIGYHDLRVAKEGVGIEDLVRVFA